MHNLIENFKVYDEIVMSEHVYIFEEWRVGINDIQIYVQKIEIKF